MKNLITTLLTVGLIGAGFAGQSLAQSVKQDKKESREAAAASSLYVISAKAGAVNYVSGKVAIDKGNAKSGYLVKGDTVEKGEKVRTESDGKTEILLNPGSYVRLAENTNFNFDSTALDDLQVSLNSGSAMFEVITDDDFNVTVKTPKSKFNLIKSGIYRIDALADGTGKISVWKGKAAYGAGKNDTVKGGQTTAIINGQISVQKFDRDNKGEFEVWSKDRSKELAKINERLQNRTMNVSLISAFNRDPSGWGNSFGSGYWVLDPLSRSYCFLPFQNGYRSPYGYGFNSYVWGYQAPWAIYQRYPNIYNQNQNNVNNGGNNGVSNPNPNPNPNNGNNQNAGGTRPNRGEGRPNWGGNRPPREGMNRPPSDMGDRPSMSRPPMSNPSMSDPSMSRPSNMNQGSPRGADMPVFRGGKEMGSPGSSERAVQKPIDQ